MGGICPLCDEKLIKSNKYYQEIWGVSEVCEFDGICPNCGLKTHVGYGAVDYYS